MATRKKSPKKSPKKTGDVTAADELLLYIDNTSDLSLLGPSGQGRSTALNALRKWRKGVYKPELAVTLFSYLVEAGAKRYAKEFGSGPWNQMFDPATRRLAAEQLEGEFRRQVENGEFDYLDRPKAPVASEGRHMAARTRDLDTFTTAYVEAMLWSTTDESDDRGGVPLDENYSISDIAPGTMARIKQDCAAFQEANQALIDGDTSAQLEQYGNDSVAGHDFWLTRNGHGAGFWDGDWPKNGDKLAKAAEEYGEVWPYVGDDGRIYISGGGHEANESRRSAVRETRGVVRAPRPHETEPIARDGGTVSDFDGRFDLIAHARQEGATHVLLGKQMKIYFPNNSGGNRPYTEARVWKKGGYWHTEAPSDRSRISKLPKGAEPLRESEPIARETEPFAREGQTEFEVVSRGAVIGHITDASFKRAEGRLISGKAGGWYPKDATIRPALTYGRRPGRAAERRGVASHTRRDMPTSAARSGDGDDPADARKVLEWLGPYFQHEGLDAARESARIAKMVYNANSSKKRDAVLEYVNDKIGGHGVEAIRDENAYDNYYGDAVATYVNMGDPYVATILHDLRDGELHLTGWGDWYEAYEQQRDSEREDEGGGDELEERRGPRVHGPRVRDYEVIDGRTDRHRAGPFKHRYEADQARGPGDVVRYVPGGGRARERRPKAPGSARRRRR